MNKEAKSETRFAVTTQLLQMRHSRHSSPEIVHVTRANKKEAYPIRPVNGYRLHDKNRHQFSDKSTSTCLTSLS